MCGLSCFISKKEINLNVLSKFNKRVMHRGPDWQDEKIFKCESYFIGMGHTRLSIIDLTSKANQPFDYLNRYKIIYNGEIYNYLEVKQVLIEKGIKFRTESDTEVLIASYFLWGEGMLKIFNGMFSFVILDLQKKTLFAVRDRFGVKPLYYYQEGDNLYFLWN